MRTFEKRYAKIEDCQ